jgi:hypothetical protein
MWHVQVQQSYDSPRRSPVRDPPCHRLEPASFLPQPHELPHRLTPDLRGTGRHQSQYIARNFNMRRSLKTCTAPRPLQRLVTPTK